jgi:hypothetical protein
LLGTHRRLTTGSHRGSNSIGASISAGSAAVPDRVYPFRLPG